MFNFKPPGKYTDFRKDQYDRFLFQSKKIGIVYNLGVNPLFIQAQQIDAEAEENNKIPDIPLDHFFPNISTYALIGYERIEKQKEEAKKKLEKAESPEEIAILTNFIENASMPSLRTLLRRQYCFYDDEILNVKILLKDQIVSEVQGQASEILFPKDDIFALASMEKMTKVKITLLMTGLDRLKHEEESLIYKTDEYVERFLDVENQKNLLNYLKKKDENLYNERLKMWTLKDSKIEPLNFNFKKVFSFETFYKIIEHSKYSNDFLLNLDKDTRDEADLNKMLEVLKMT